MSASSYLDDLAEIYEAVPIHGGANRTNEGIETAKKEFIAFLASSKKNYDEMTENELCNVALFQFFARYLLNKKKKDDEFIKFQTALQYLSGVRNLLHRKFPSNVLWDNEEWLSQIRKNIERIAVIRCIELGLPVYDDKLPIGRDLLMRISSAFVEKG